MELNSLSPYKTLGIGSALPAPLPRQQNWGYGEAPAVAGASCGRHATCLHTLRAPVRAAHVLRSMHNGSWASGDAAHELPGWSASLRACLSPLH